MKDVFQKTRPGGDDSVEDPFMLKVVLRARSVEDKCSPLVLQRNNGALHTLMEEGSGCSLGP